MKHRKAITLTAVALVALLPLAAFAEPGPGHRGRGPGKGFLPPPGYLDLSDEQIEASRAIRESVRAEMEPLRDERRALREQLKTALEDENPDAAAVGQMVIEIHGLRGQTRTILENAEGQFSALLTAEQLEKWENFKELRSSRRGPRHRGAGSGFGGGSSFGGGPIG